VWHAAPIRALRRCRLLSSAALLAALGNLTGAAAYCVVAWELALGMGDIHACWPIHCAIKLLVRAKTAHSCGSQQCNRRLHAVDGLIDRCESQRIAHDAVVAAAFRMLQRMRSVLSAWQRGAERAPIVQWTRASQRMARHAR
jgi:hypothetical protein